MLQALANPRPKRIYESKGERGPGQGHLDETSGPYEHSMSESFKRGNISETCFDSAFAMLRQVMIINGQTSLCAM